MKVHLEGMGVVGSLLAWQLKHHRIPFTWHDTEEERTAWKASTGCVYPGGTATSKSRHCYDVWSKWIEEGIYPEGCTEWAEYWFNQKNPPHQGKYPIITDLGAGKIRTGSKSLHFNAQFLVKRTRDVFKVKYLPLPALKSPHWYIVAHGFNSRLVRYLWGWSCLVQLEFSKKLEQNLAGFGRPCFYFRQGRFLMAYAYPCPGTPYWYAGSSLINQRVAKELDAERKFQQWQELFYKLSGHQVKFTEQITPLVQGWRPVSGKSEAEIKGKYQELSIQTNRRSKRIITPPLWHSGFRHFPIVWEQIWAELQRR